MFCQATISQHTALWFPVILRAYRRIVIVVLLEYTLDCFRDCWLVICPHRQVSAHREVVHQSLTERNVGEKVVCDVVVRNLNTKPSVSPAFTMLVRVRRRRLTLWKKKRPIQPSVGRSTVEAAPRRNDHSSLRKCGIVGSEWWRKVTITNNNVSKVLQNLIERGAVQLTDPESTRHGKSQTAH